MSDQEVTIYHSPDADDAFMFYGLTSGAISSPGFKFTHELCDIETLNQRTIAGELSCTAVSVHAFAYLKNQYVVTSCGASMGEKDYGPCLVAREKFSLGDGVRRRIATPGKYTSATLALRIFLHENDIDAELIDMKFDKVDEAVRDGNVDAGLIIHEGQITHQRSGLVSLLDFGQWWWEETGMPLPLGVNIVRKDLGKAAIQATANVLLGSITYSLEHRKEALEYALSYGRGITMEEADTFVGMYVNDRTIDLGEDGKASIQEFLRRGVAYGIVPETVEVEFVQAQLPEFLTARNAA